jgi:hypothetical protein
MLDNSASWSTLGINQTWQRMNLVNQDELQKLWREDDELQYLPNLICGLIDSQEQGFGRNCFPGVVSCKAHASHALIKICEESKSMCDSHRGNAGPGWRRGHQCHSVRLH